MAIVCAASADRLIEDVYAMFKTSGKPEMVDVIKGLLGQVDDLKGMDRTKPFGMMLYVNTGLPPSIAPVGFVPVKNMNELMKTIAKGPFTMKPVPEKKNRYEIGFPNQSLQILVKNGYAFISNDEAAFDRKFPDPANIAKSLVSRFDIAASVQMNSIPKATRELFATYLRASSEAEIQQRDGEPQVVYEARRARGLRDLAFVEGLLLDGENLVIGFDASPKNLTVELVLNARPKSKFAKLLKAIGGKRSEFANILSAKSPFSASICMTMSKADQKAFIGNVRFMERQISRGLKRAEKRSAEKKKKDSKAENTFDPNKKPKPQRKKMEEIPNHPAVTKMAESLIATANKGVADAFIQVMGEPPGKFAVVVGVRLEEGRQFASGLSGLLQEIKRIEDPGIQLNATTYKGVSFHRVTPKRLPGPMRRFFGDNASLLLGAGSKTAWIAFGGENGLAALRQAMDLKTDRSQIGKRKESSAPFQLAFNMSSWLAMGGDDGRPGIKLAREAFSKGGDDIRVELQTTENGIRIRGRLGQGFIRFIGLSLHRQHMRNRPNF
ncbi:MAG: hypothetical protein Tsb009_23590 [Planctomycetaceae bacterium]